MAEQISLYAVECVPKKRDNVRRRWEDGFQRWCNREMLNESDGFGVCGFGAICDFCEDNTFGRPCVRALSSMCREKRISIDYEKTDYKDAWFGRVGGGYG